jgi:hypothetical protein
MPISFEVTVGVHRYRVAMGIRGLMGLSTGCVEDLWTMEVIDLGAESEA